MITPASDNIIFFDTEFTDLDVKKGELLSIGLVKPNGEELYIELPYTKEPHEWVKEHVLPHLSGELTSYEDARIQITEFLGDTKPHLIAFINQLDSVYWYDFFGSPQAHPAHKHPIDFGSILFGHGFKTTSMSDPDFLDMLKITAQDRGVGHNALDDAKFLRKVYNSFYEHLSQQYK